MYMVAGRRGEGGGGRSLLQHQPTIFWVPLKNQRQIRPKKSEDYKTTNIVDRPARRNSRCLAVDTTQTAVLGNSFTVSTNSCGLEQPRRQHRLRRDGREI